MGTDISEGSPRVVMCSSAVSGPDLCSEGKADTGLLSCT